MWVSTSPGVPPVIDALNYLDSVQRRSADTMSVIETVTMLKGGAWPVQQELEFLNEFFRFCGIDLRHLVVFRLLFRLNRRLAIRSSVVVLLQRESERVDFVVTNGASCVAAMLFKPLAKRQIFAGSIRFDLADVCRGIR